jgi:hypothetical protein
MYGHLNIGLNVTDGLYRHCRSDNRFLLIIYIPVHLECLRRGQASYLSNIFAITPNESINAHRDGNVRLA